MISDLATRLETDVRHLKEHQGFEDDFTFDDESAWITDNSCDFYVDWQIVELPEEILQEV